MPARNSKAVRVASGVDWLSLDVAFSADGQAVDEDELRGALKKGRKLVKLADGSWAPVKTEEVEIDGQKRLAGMGRHGPR